MLGMFLLSWEKLYLKLRKRSNWLKREYAINDRIAREWFARFYAKNFNIEDSEDFETARYVLDGKNPKITRREFSKFSKTALRRIKNNSRSNFNSTAWDGKDTDATKMDSSWGKAKRRKLKLRIWHLLKLVKPTWKVWIRLTKYQERCKMDRKTEWWDQPRQGQATTTVCLLALKSNHWLRISKVW